MTQSEQQFYKTADGSAQVALEEARKTIQWMEHLLESEYTELEREKVIMLCQKLYTGFLSIGETVLDRR